MSTSARYLPMPTVSFKRIRDDIAPKVAADRPTRTRREHATHGAHGARPGARKGDADFLKDDTEVYKQFVRKRIFSAIRD